MNLENLLKHQEAMEQVVEQYQITADALTKNVLAQAILQAIACGDFTRLVVAGPEHKEGVVYIPYQREQDLLGKLAEVNKWHDAQTEKPLDDTDCVVLFTVDGEKQFRAPVFWWDEKQLWKDEWSNTIGKEAVLKFMLLGNL